MSSSAFHQHGMHHHHQHHAHLAAKDLPPFSPTMPYPSLHNAAALAASMEEGVDPDGDFASPGSDASPAGFRDGRGDEAGKITSSDRECWSMCKAAGLFVCCVAGLWCAAALDFSEAIGLYTAEYFVVCAVGGAIGGLPHLFVVPIDLLKCRTQVGEYASFTEGWASLRRESAAARTRAEKADVWLRGWFPTLVGYTTQGAAKFGLYELFKFILASSVSYEFAVAHMTALFMLAAALAELFADLFLAPWEALKVRLQTSRQYPPVMAVIMPRLWALEGWRGYFKGLPALWGRQIPYTIVKFATFEHSVRQLVRFYAWASGAPTPNTGPVMLLLTVTGGYVAGSLCATASHPADTILSKLNSRQDTRVGFLGLLQQLPCREIWRGWLLRVGMVGTLTALQWIGYDGFKFYVGLPTTGRTHRSASSSGDGSGSGGTGHDTAGHAGILQHPHAPTPTLLG